ncbi:MBL fold metallo-hydrolase [Corynebacterium otitidis]|uniref:Metallo-beta-lactamase domain-containing protein n=1 Tax=Corynebacterium otitidis ATCC 51513 TaxID=883169 RepID=I7KJP0_9CORY|nr:MBL fold metallo-hydrolase [Corynebacterium otitidis]EJZ81818.1 hypothetical protein HMPREF9719_01239 [Corynebacterium otitidis ATCC 51513]CCI83745.1 hypothetical protein BN46_1017 [Corynebacterium otitidis ATCC 51513]
MAAKLRIDKVVTSGSFELDGGSWDVDNNIWLVGDDTEVIVVDAAHDAAPIIDAVGERAVKAIVCTHAHNDHIAVAPELARRLDAPILVHPDDQVLWDKTLPGVEHGDLADGQRIAIAGEELVVLHTPGHSPGSCCLYALGAGALFSGDTLFNGGPGATGRSYSSFDTIIESLKEKVLTLPGDTEVYTGHGEGTTIGDEAPHLDEWIERGY